MTDSIHHRAREVTHAFETAHRLSHLIPEPCEARQDASSNPKEEVEDAYARFRLWAGNLGAIHAPRDPKSLDYRLRVERAVTQRIQDTLTELIDLLTRLIIWDPNKAVNGTVEVEGGTDEIDEFLVDFLDLKTSPSCKLSWLTSSITDTVRHLFKISRLIERSTTRDRYVRAEAAVDCRFDDHYDIAHVRSKYDGRQAETWLLDRLGKAITKRRMFIKYSRDHRERIEDGVRIEETLATGQRTLTEVPTQHQMIPSVRPSEMSKPSQQQTTASTLGPIDTDFVDDGFDDDDRSHYTTATSVSDGRTPDRLRVCRLEDVAELSEPFQCPYCCTVQKFNGQISWERHVFADLRAYLCTFQGCGMTMFAKRRDWIAHELEKHRRQWVCQLCTRTSFQTEESLLIHISRTHTSSLTPEATRALGKTSSRPLQSIRVKECPLCDWDQVMREANRHVTDSEELVVTSQRFMRHLAGHLEELALFAIPRGDQEEGSSNSGNGAYASHRGRGSIVYDIHEYIDDLESEDNELSLTLEKASEPPGGPILVGNSGSTPVTRPANVSQGAEITSAWIREPRIMVVEDDESCRRITNKFLFALGCSTTLAVDGLEAVNALSSMTGSNASEDGFDLVLMDTTMPNLDGVSATHLIRQFNNTTPIVAITTEIRSPDIQMYFEHGMSDVLAKPFTKDHLFKILEKHLQHLDKKTPIERRAAPNTQALKPETSNLHVVESFVGNRVLQTATTSTPTLGRSLSRASIQQYATLFDSSGSHNGDYMSWVTAETFFKRSGLSSEIVEKVWTVANRSRAGFIHKLDFILAMHLLHCISSGITPYVPEKIPPELDNALNRYFVHGPSLEFDTRNVGDAIEVRAGVGAGTGPVNISRLTKVGDFSSDGKTEVTSQTLVHSRHDMPTSESGWQTTFDHRHRSDVIVLLSAQLGMVHSAYGRCLEVAKTWESRTFDGASSEAVYLTEMFESLSEVIVRCQPLGSSKAGNDRLLKAMETNLARLHGRGFLCTRLDCMHRFDRASDLRKHVQRSHAPREKHPWQCPHPGCGKGFIYPKDVSRHCRQVHGEDSLRAPSSLPALDLISGTDAESKRHLDCPRPDCSKRFTTVIDLMRHLFSVHDQALYLTLSPRTIDYQHKQDEPYKGEAGDTRERNNIEDIARQQALQRQIQRANEFDRLRSNRGLLAEEDTRIRT